MTRRTFFAPVLLAALVALGGFGNQATAEVTTTLPTNRATAPTFAALPPSSASQQTEMPGSTAPEPDPQLETENGLSRLSIDFLRQQKYPGSDIVIEQKLAGGSNYDRYIASYRSEGLKIYALLTLPRGQRPATGWPVIVFNHGYIPPTQYRTTERYVAYVDGFARAGYIVFRPDYRGHGNSEGEPTGAYGSPNYVIDVLNAVASVKRYSAADPNRIGMWGHSMGGWITLRAMVVSPDIKAGVIWGGVVGSYEDLLAHWRRNRPGAPPGSSTGRRNWRVTLVEKYGDPAANPGFWRTLSPNYYLTDLAGPIQLYHARGDASVPVKLSEVLYQQGKAEGMPIELITYPGDNHNISGNFGRAMAGSVAFFDRWVKQPVNFRQASGPTLYPRVDRANLRSGPGTGFSVVNSLRIGQTLPVIGRTEDGSWWQVQAANGPAWIAATVAVATHTAEVPVIPTSALSG